MRVWLLPVALLCASPVLAEVTPSAGAGDPHIQSVAYDPAQVIALHVAQGFAVTVQFAPDERIETVTLGDSANWQVQTNKRADALVVKPLGPAPPTNLTVLSDGRSYNFALYSAYAGEGVQPYFLSFTYPLAAAEQPKSSPQTGRYTLSGDKALWPVEMSDDGQFTRLRWADGAAMPAVYSADAWGNRALLNGVVRDGAYVVEGVFARLAFIAGGHGAKAKRLPPAPLAEAQP